LIYQGTIVADSRKLIEAQAKVFSAVAHPLRLSIVHYLAEGERCVCDIAEYLQAGRPNVSKHLALMVEAGVLESRKQGLRMIYSLKTPCLLKLLSCVTDVVRRQAEDSAALLESLQVQRDPT
jgi:ArsR family transcriptional regulator